MNICIDLDGVICCNKKENESYSDLKPLPGAVKSLNQFKKYGHYIIIYTSRHMGTCQSNEGKIVANLFYLYKWLKKYKIPYDEIKIGKPRAEIYIDDRGYRYENWEKTLKYVNKYAKNH